MDKPGAIYVARPMTDPSADRVALATVFSSLRTPGRIHLLQIVDEHGPVATKELKKMLRRDPTGQLEDFLAAGLVTRTQRSHTWVWDVTPGAFERVSKLLA